MSEVAMAGLAFTIVPRHVLGRGYRAPSDTLDIACIGVGGMGRNDVTGVAGENIYALCDVDWRMAQNAFGTYPRAKRFRDFRELLEKDGKNIDAVTVSTPDHTHAVAAMMALKMGKHVYCQKPLARTVSEVRALVDQAKRSKGATQMGNQGHANEGTRQIREWVEAGVIGTVSEVQFWTNRPIWPQGVNRPTDMHHVPPTLDWDLWLGPAAARPYHPGYSPFNWRGWWDFGTGALGDMACHIMDAAFWVLDLRYPSRIIPESTQLNPETAPRASRIEFEFPARGSRPPVKLVWRDGSITPSRPADWPIESLWPFEDSGQLWVGDKGTLVAGTYGDNPRTSDEKQNMELKATPPKQTFARTKGVYSEWVDACKGGAKAGSNFVDHAGPLTEMILLGNLAVRVGRTLELNPATGQITNAQIPDEYLRPVYRAGWSL
ncbi:MAG: Gfo/Idh/MocA family protein [Gemmatimonadaceae bacterium]